MIDEIVKLNLNYSENVILCHTMIAIWNQSALDLQTIPENILAFAEELTDKYSKDEGHTELLDFVDRLLSEECDKIRKKRSVAEIRQLLSKHLSA